MYQTLNKHSWNFTGQNSITCSTWTASASIFFFLWSTGTGRYDRNRPARRMSIRAHVCETARERYGLDICMLQVVFCVLDAKSTERAIVSWKIHGSERLWTYFLHELLTVQYCSPTLDSYQVRWVGSSAILPLIPSQLATHPAARVIQESTPTSVRPPCVLERTDFNQVLEFCISTLAGVVDIPILILPRGC